MYKNILIPLENSCYDEVILKHIRPLAKLTNASITLVHVADGFMARNQKDLGESGEMSDDYQYLKSRELELHSEGFEVKTVLLFGEPSKEILALAEKEHYDLIAMATHGHRGLSDITVSYTHLRAHETVLDLVCRLLLEKKKNKKTKT